MNKSIDKLPQADSLGAVTTYQAGILQANVNRLLQSTCDNLLQPYGITKVQWLVIGAALDAGDQGIRITDIANQLGTTLGFLTNTVNTLALKDILIRLDNHSDSRSKLVAVHPPFRARCLEIETRLRQGLRDAIYAHVDPQEFHTYMKVLHQMANISKDTTTKSKWSEAGREL